MIETRALAKAIDCATEHLVRAVDDTGRFLYRAHVDQDISLSNQYNALRHAGTIAALAWSHERAPAAPLRTAIGRSWGFLHQHLLAEIPGRSDLLGLWSRPEIEGTQAAPAIKLGGVALAALAGAHAARCVPGLIVPGTLERLGAALLWLQRPDGSFFHRVRGADGFRLEAPACRFYPGEAALALVALHENDGDPRWLTASERALLHLTLAESAEVDHWALIATERWLRQPASHARPARERIIARAVANADAIVARRAPPDVPARKRGALSADARVTTTSCRLEGLFAALLAPQVCAGGHVSMWRTAADEATAFLLRAQLPAGPLAGGFPRFLSPDPDPAPPSLRKRRKCGEVRIDFAQHALHALLLAERLHQQIERGDIPAASVVSRLSAACGVTA